MTRTNWMALRKDFGFTHASNWNPNLNSALFLYDFYSVNTP